MDIRKQLAIGQQCREVMLDKLRRQEQCLLDQGHSRCQLRYLILQGGQSTPGFGQIESSLDELDAACLCQMPWMIAPVVALFDALVLVQSPVDIARTYAFRESEMYIKSRMAQPPRTVSPSELLDHQLHAAWMYFADMLSMLAMNPKTPQGLDERIGELTTLHAIALEQDKRAEGVQSFGAKRWRDAGYAVEISNKLAHVTGLKLERVSLN